MNAAKELAEENSSVQGVTISLASVADRAGLTKPADVSLPDQGRAHARSGSALRRPVARAAVCRCGI